MYVNPKGSPAAIRKARYEAALLLANKEAAAKVIASVKPKG